MRLLRLYKRPSTPTELNPHEILVFSDIDGIVKSRDSDDIIKILTNEDLEDAADGPYIFVGTFLGVGNPGNDPGTTALSPPFLNGWENLPGAHSWFRKNKIGQTEISATIQSGTIGLPAWILPVDYRPSSENPLVSSTVRVIQPLTGRGFALVEVLPSGEVIMQERMVIPDTAEFGGG